MPEGWGPSVIPVWFLRAQELLPALALAAQLSCPWQGCAAPGAGLAHIAWSPPVVEPSLAYLGCFFLPIPILVRFLGVTVCGVPVMPPQLWVPGSDCVRGASDATPALGSPLSWLPAAACPFPSCHPPSCGISPVYLSNSTWKTQVWIWQSHPPSCLPCLGQFGVKAATV